MIEGEYTGNQLERSVDQTKVTEPLPDLWDKGVERGDWEKFHDLTLDYLKSNDYIDINDEGEIQADLDKLSKFSTREFNKKFPNSNEGGLSISTRKLIAGSKAEIFANVFADKQVYAKGHEEEGKKTLIFIPRSEDDLGDIEAMRNSWMSIDQLGRVGNWATPYPTRQKGFDSEINLMDVAVPYLIYAKGNGERDENGKLLVDDNGKRVPISGAWILRNGIQGPEESRFDDSPRRVVEEYGAEWIKHDLLLPTDIPEPNWAKTERSITEDKGRARVAIDGKVFYLGPTYAGGKVEEIAPNMHLVSAKNSEQSALLDSELDRRDRSEANIVDLGNGRKQLSVPKGVTERHFRSINELGTFYNFSYEGNNKRREAVDMSRELPSVLALRESLSSQNKKELANLELEEQINMNLLIRDLGREGRGLEFIEKTGEDGMRLLADMRSRGGADRRLIEELLEMPTEKSKDLLLQYNRLRKATDELMDSLYESVENNPNIGIGHLGLIERTSDAIKSRSPDLLQVAATTENSVSAERMKVLTEGIGKVNSLINNQTEAQFDYMPDPNQGANAARYTFEDGSILTINIRPEDHETGGARIGIKYRDKDKKKAEFRIDKDEYGLSLDISGRYDELSSDLAELGKTYHTPGVFEKGLNANDNDFKEFAETIPHLLNWPR